MYLNKQQKTLIGVFGSIIVLVAAMILIAPSLIVSGSIDGNITLFSTNSVTNLIPQPHSTVSLPNGLNWETVHMGCAVSSYGSCIVDGVANENEFIESTRTTSSMTSFTGHSSFNITNPEYLFDSSQSNSITYNANISSKFIKSTGATMLDWYIYSFDILAKNGDAYALQIRCGSSGDKLSIVKTTLRNTVSPTNTILNSTNFVCENFNAKKMKITLDVWNDTSINAYIDDELKLTIYDNNQVIGTVGASVLSQAYCGSSCSVGSEIDAIMGVEITTCTCGDWTAGAGCNIDGTRTYTRSCENSCDIETKNEIDVTCNCPFECCINDISYTDKACSEGKICQANACVEPSCPTCPTVGQWSSCDKIGDESLHSRINYKCSAETSYECESYTESEGCSIPAVDYIPYAMGIVIVIALIGGSLYYFKDKFRFKRR